MAIGTIHLTLDTFRCNYIDDIIVVRGDYESRFIRAFITADGSSMYVAQTAVAAINAQRSDGLSKSFYGTVNTDGSVCVPLTQWMSDVVGRVKCSVSVVCNGKKISTTDFYIRVQDQVSDSSDATNDIPQKDVIFETYDAILKLADGFEKGEGKYSVVQKQGGAFATDGTPYEPSTAPGISAASLGVGNKANGPCNFNAGHGNTTYQYDAAAFGGGNLVGNKERQELYEAVLDFASGDTVLKKSTYLLNHWEAFKVNWNAAHPEKQIGQATYRDFCHIYKFSCGLAGGLDNKLEGRAAGTIGTYNDIPGENTFGLGNHNFDSGNNSLIGGEYCYNAGNNNLLLGLYLESRGGHNKVIFGRYNLDRTDMTLFEVGNGWSTRRQNAFEVRTDGSANVSQQGTEDTSVVIKKTLAGYLPIDNTTSNYSHRLYGIDSKGGQVKYQATNGNAANAVAKRDARGGCQFADPQYAQDAATKNYVDNKFANGITVGSTYVSEEQLKKLLALLN